MMRIPSGVTDQYIYFVAVDSTDYVTRETGLSSFTVYRSRNGGAATAYTTPTIAELSAANMPGVYSLLLDEDMTIDSGDDSQEICLHITATGMAPVTRTFELYRPKVTAGATLDSTGAGLTAIPWNAAWDAEVQSEVDDGLVARGLDHLINVAVTGTDITDNSIIAKMVSKSATADWDSFVNTTDALEAIADSSSTPPTAAAIADAVWEELIADHSGTSGSTAEALAAAGSAGDPWTTALPGAYTAGQAGYIVGTYINASLSAILADTNELQTDWVNGGRLDLLIDAILADTNELQTDWTNGGRLDLIVDAILADTAELQTDWVDGGRLDLLIDAILADTSELQTDWVNGGRLDLLIDAILADTNELQTDWTNGGRLDLLIDAILDDTGTTGVAVSSAAQLNVADAVLGRSVANVEDTAGANSLAAVILLQTNSSRVDTTITATKVGGGTFATYTITTGTGLDDITGIS